MRAMKPADLPARKRAAHRVEQPHKSGLLARLNRIEGQVRGVAAMIEQDRYCIDVLIQISAARSALDAVALQMLKDHTHGCVQHSIKSGSGKQAIDELLEIMGKLLR